MTRTQNTPESITHALHMLAKAHGTTFATEYRAYRPERGDVITETDGTFTRTPCTCRDPHRAGLACGVHE